MSSVVIVEKLGVALASPKNDSHRYRFISPLECDTALRQVRRDLQLSRSSGGGDALIGDRPVSRSVRFSENEVDLDSTNFVRHYAVPKQSLPDSSHEHPKTPVMKLLNCESESNFVLEKLRNILLEKPVTSKAAKPNTPHSNIRSRKPEDRLRKVNAPRVMKHDSELDWLGPAYAVRRNEIFNSKRHKNDITVASPAHEVLKTPSNSSSVVAMDDEHNILRRKIKDTLKKIEDDEASIEKRLANLSLSSSSSSSSISLHEPAGSQQFTEERQFHRKIVQKSSRDEICQTDYLISESSSHSEPELPSAAESVLDELERGDFYEKLLKYELDLLT